MCAQVHESPPLLTLEEAARRLSYSPAHVRRLVVSRGLPAIQIGPGAALRFDQAELDAWIEQRRKTTFEMSTMGGGSLEARSGSPLGRSSFVDAPAEREGTSRRHEAVEPARLAGGETT